MRWRNEGPSLDGRGEGRVSGVGFIFIPTFFLPH